MTIAAITGGRDYHPELVELERLEERMAERGVTVLRHGDARGVDRTVGGWLKARGVIEPERWPAEWKAHGKSAGPRRNREMLDGYHREGPRPPVEVLFAFEGGKGTADCTGACTGAMLERAMTRGASSGAPVEWVAADLKHEPRICSGEQKMPPGPWVNVANGPPPWEHGEAVTPWRGAVNPLSAPPGSGVEGYKRWLWAKMRERPPSPQLAMLHHLRPDHFLVCSCWPRPCHAEAIVHAWRWVRDTGRLG